MIFFAALLLQHTITLRDPIPPNSGSIQSIFICNETSKISISYVNDWLHGKRGKVTSVAVSGKEVMGVAKYLTSVAHNRAIQSIIVKECGPSESNLRIFAEMELSEVGSKRDGLPKLHFFRFNENGLVER